MHQELFRRVEKLADLALPPEYRMTTDPDSAAAAMLRKSTWAVIALTCFVEIFTQQHYLHSIRDDGQLSPLFKDVFYYHWVEEVQHATLLKAYRLQYVVSGARIERFQRALSSKLTSEQMLRVETAFAPLIAYVDHPSAVGQALA